MDRRPQSTVDRAVTGVPHQVIAAPESVRLELKDENTQCICHPEGGIEGASRYLYVVMPMRL